MSGNKKKEQKYVDDRGWFEWLFSNVDSGRYIQAQKDLATMTAGADPDAELASLFKDYGEFMGDYRVTTYRHLNPADSTVSYTQGYTDYFHDEGYEDGFAGKSYDDRAYENALQNVKSGAYNLTPKEVALLLAKHRMGK